MHEHMRRATGEARAERQAAYGAVPAGKRGALAIPLAWACWKSGEAEEAGERMLEAAIAGEPAAWWTWTSWMVSCNRVEEARTAVEKLTHEEARLCQIYLAACAALESEVSARIEALAAQTIAQGLAVQFAAFGFFNAGRVDLALGLRSLAEAYGLWGSLELWLGPNALFARYGVDAVYVAFDVDRFDAAAADHVAAGFRQDQVRP
jgi:hypothetical protein